MARAPASLDAAIKQAKSLFRRFTGHAPVKGDVGVLKTSAESVAVMIVGNVDAIIYSTTRDGVREQYIHEFGRKASDLKLGRTESSRPVLAISHDGEQAYILAGGYRFTERGFIG